MRSQAEKSEWSDQGRITMSVRFNSRRRRDVREEEEEEEEENWKAKKLG